MKVSKTMQNKFLNYYKLILDKVSFDRQLFMKEYRKALGWLSPREVDDLHRWLEAKGLSVPLSSDAISYDGWQRHTSSAVELQG